LSEYNERKSSALSPAIRAAFIGLLIMLAAIALVLFLFQTPLLIVYPLQAFLYFLVGRIAGNIARNEDPNAGLQLGMESDVNFSAVGGMGGLSLCIGIWLVYSIISFGLEMAYLGGFIGSIFGVALCFALDLPLAIGLGVLGGKTAEPRNS